MTLRSWLGMMNPALFLTSAQGNLSLLAEGAAETMSNYLFAMGNESKISCIHKQLVKLNPKQIDEISMNHQFGDYWSLIIERRPQHIDTSIQNLNSEEKRHGSFFKGWFQDHDTQSIVVGPSGYHEWRKSSNPTVPLDYEGTFVHACWDQNILVIENDLFSYFPVMFFSTPDIVVASDSLFVLSKIRGMLGLRCKLNRDVIHSRAWTHGLACAVMSNQTIIKGIQLLSPGKHIEVQFNLRAKSIAQIIHQPLKEKFVENFTSYPETLIDATRKLYASTMSLLHLDDIHINFGLSGGLDSRLILGVLLKNPEVMNKVSITTNIHPSREADLAIVSSLAEKYGFKFNNKKLELSEHRKSPDVESTTISNAFGLWVLSNLGLFDMMYLHNSHWKHPNVIELGGHGAETVKGTFTPMKFEDYLHRKTMTRKFSFKRSYWRDRSLVKASQRRWDGIRNEMENGLESSGISLDEPGAIQWHHLCYKSPIQNGRFLNRSIIAIRPFIQRSLFALSKSNLNPFLNAAKGEPTLLHDMLILLDPELAAEPFDNPKKNLTPEYIQQQQKIIDSPLTFEDIVPYTIHGSATDILNGPPNIFMAMVNGLDFEGDDMKKMTLKLLEENWSKIEGTPIGEIYQSAYDMAKVRLTDPDFYPPSAGTPAAKIIALLMIDD